MFSLLVFLSWQILNILNVKKKEKQYYILSFWDKVANSTIGRRIQDE